MHEISGDLAVLCRHGLIVEINSAGWQMLGARGAEDLLDDTFADQVTADYTQIVADLLALRVIELVPTPVQLRRIDGSAFDAALLIHPARELGEGYAVVTARDTSHEGLLARSARESKDRFHLLVERSMHMICECRGGQVSYLNPAGAEMLRIRGIQGLLGWTIWDIFADEYRDIFAADVEALLAERTILPVRLRRFDGDIFDAQILVTRLHEQSANLDFMIEARDITGHNRAVGALRQMNETLEHKVAERTLELAREKMFVEGLLEAVPNPLWWKDVDGRFLGYNRAFRQAHGVSGESWVGRRMEEVLPEADCSTAALADHDVVARARIEYEAAMTDAEGARRNVVVCKTTWRSGDANTPAGIIGVMMDITERKKMEAELRRLATTDAMTGCLNRRRFLELAQGEFIRSQRSRRPYTVLMLDIDHFKRINDNFGHPVGDEAIKALVAVCQATIRTPDHLGRLGGEEFAIVLPETTGDGAIFLAERLRKSVSKISLPTAQGAVEFTTSIGLAEFRPDDISAEATLSRADQALYRAKNGGRNRVIAWTAEAEAVNHP
jgi:diguanylate cyclase (GGDEF)-like protein/PAS domain S-box-containing protein